jgi:Transposase
MQAWQIRQNLQDVFTMPSVASARKYLSRWHAWVSTCDLLPMKKAASTIMAKADEILRSISSNLSNGLLEAINGNVQAASVDVWPPVAEPLEAHIVGWRDGGEACQLPEDAAKWMVRAKNSGSCMSYAWIAIGNCPSQRACMRGKLVSQANAAATRRLGRTNFCEN